MSAPPEKSQDTEVTPEAKAKAERAARLAAALRDNLKRRKAARPAADDKRN